MSRREIQLWTSPLETEFSVRAMGNERAWPRLTVIPGSQFAVICEKGKEIATAEVLEALAERLRHEATRDEL